jgi:hypothetical protein
MTDARHLELSVGIGAIRSIPTDRTKEKRERTT